MKKDRKTGRRSDEGIALLIAIFVLLLISVVAIALLVSSSTETALGANYRSSSTVYYAALAGLEEARGRLLPTNPTYFGSTYISPTTQFPLGQTLYVINRGAGDNIVPYDSSNAYYDNEYQTEFGQPASSASWQTVPSVWDNNAQSIPGPIYKWVRITAATEQSLYLDVNSDGTYDHSLPIYYDAAQLDSHGNPAPSLILTPSPPSTAVQVLQITALAYLPNGSQKLLQYVVAPIGVNLLFPAALTMDGPNAGTNATYPFSLPYSAAFLINAYDQLYFYNSGAKTCSLGSNPTPLQARAIGYVVNGGGDTSYTTITSAIGPSNHGDYLGFGPLQPNVYYVGNPPPPGPPTLSSNLQTLTGLNSVVSSVSQVADVTLDGTVTPVQQNDSHNVMPAAMSATNPMTVVVDGDLDTTGWSGTGYGILLVTGTYTYGVNSSWNGIVLVIGKGVLYSSDSGPGTGQINGAVLVATTVGSVWGSPTVDFNGGSAYGSLGINYSSCWIQFVQGASKYKVLSFHEIPQS